MASSSSLVALAVDQEYSHRYSFAAADVYKHSPSDCPTTEFSADDAQHPGEPDVVVLTSGGLRIPVHSTVLASASSVLENIIERSSCTDKVITISGVPCGAVAAFIRYLYLLRCKEEEMEKYGIHLLVLSHVYVIPKLKQGCSKGICEQLRVENVVDLVKLARMCDAPDVYLKCIKFLNSNFKSVEMTEGWKFMQDHDPCLELHILHFIDQTEQRKRKRRRHREEQRVYMELSEAMECLKHIFTEGCTIVRPRHIPPYNIIENRSKYPAASVCRYNSITCNGLQQLITHFAACNLIKIRNNAAYNNCSRCKRMWQLLRLHSSICDDTSSCRVPLCRQLKMKTQQQEEISWNKEDKRWRLLVIKVVSAKVMSSLSSSITQTGRRRRRREPINC